MKKFLILICTFVLLLSGCKKEEKSVLLLTSGQITPENYAAKQYKITFGADERIDFILYNPKPLKSNIVKIQVLKLESNGFASGYSISYARSIQIDNNLNYVTDYFYVHQKGSFVLRIFSTDDFYTPVAEAQFTLE